ncbi:asparagine synthase C-terminal domain-containing protein [Luteimonas saliphila]|uniref:asparagine synthase-related protein n=1 Tax=Luteimonas saliphila TaxID=2804919 RepID=UPI00192DB92B|nr:asparagine synthase C-terminal domain-containing protein [Luteimonas saliphila]
MGYRYLALIGNGRQSQDRSAIRASLEVMGVPRDLTAREIELFAGAETPVLQLPDGSVVVGHLFWRGGSRVTDSAALATFVPGSRLRMFLTERCWGEYIVLQPSGSVDSGWTITRDPSGGMPCIYSLSAEGGFITSDVGLAVKAGLYRKRIDWEYIARSATYPYQKAQRTALEGISELLPGYSLSLTDAGISTEQSWSPWEFVSRWNRYTNPNDATSELRRAVTSVITALAEVDQSILLEMSGGLDSSIVAACLQESNARVVCCTLVTPVPGADERQYAGLIAEALGVELQTKVLDFERAHFCFDLESSTVSPRIGCLQYAIDNVMGPAGAEHDVASYYSGSGGDTVFSYLTNAAPATDALLAQGLSAGAAAVRDLAALHQCTLWTAGWLTIRKLLLPPKQPRSAQRTFVHPSAVASAPEPHPWFLAPADALPGDRERVFGLTDTQIYRDMAPRGADRWLRMPLLAQPVVETCLRTPSWMWIAGGKNRAVARAAFSDVLPLEILNRRSKGNFVAYLGAFYQRHRKEIRQFLLSGRLNEQRLLNSSALSRFMDREDLPMRDRVFMEILDLCMVENWIRHQS